MEMVEDWTGEKAGLRLVLKMDDVEVVVEGVGTLL